MTFRSSSQVDPGTGATTDLPVPTGAAAGDIAVVGLHLEADGTVTVPAGFTIKSSIGTGATGRLIVAWKRLTAADTGTYSFSHPSTWRSGGCALFTGRANSGDPFSPAPSTSNVTTAVTTVTCAGLTAATGSDLVGFGNSYDGGIWTGPAGMTTRVDAGNITTATADAASGATGDKTFTVTNPSAMQGFLGALPVQGAGGTLKVANAEGYADAATITTANTGSGDTFSAVSPGTAGTITATATGALKGTRSYRIAPDATTACFLALAFPATNSKSVFRGYFRKTGNPSAAVQVISWRSAGGGTTFGAIAMNTAGNLFLLDFNATNNVWTSPNPLANDVTYRIEASFDNTGLTSTSGAMELRVYQGDSATVWDGGNGPASASLSGYNLGTTAPARIQWGKVSAAGSWAATLWDDIGVVDGTLTLLGPTGLSNTPPTASAGPDQTNVEPGTTVTLTGGGSNDPDGTIASYAWTQTAGTTVTLSSTTSASPTFTAPLTMAGSTLTFSLVVTDNLGSTSAADTVNVAVLPASEAIRVSGAWSPRRAVKRSAGAWTGTPAPLPGVATGTASLILTATGSASASGATGAWMSGQSDSATTQDGSFAAWRGRAVEIAGNWASSTDAASAIATPEWFFAPGTAYANIQAADYAFGAFIDGSGESWGAAAAGNYDTRWRDQLLNLKDVWGARQASKMHIRFAHEMNGSWYPWACPPGDVSSYITAYQRWAGLVRTHFPGAKTVWCPNDESSYGYDIRTLWPGDSYVDVVSVDQYNWWPWVNDSAGWNSKINGTQNGGPKGIEQYRLFAASKGKPMAISEWSNAAVDAGGSGGGDAPNWIQYMFNWFTANGGTGAGNVLYEVLFNVVGYANHFEMYPNTSMPLAAAKYAQLW